MLKINIKNIDDEVLSNLRQMQNDDEFLYISNDDEYSIKGLIVKVGCNEIILRDFSFGYIEDFQFNPTEIVPSIHQRSYKNKIVPIYDDIDRWFYDRGFYDYPKPICYITTSGLELLTVKDETDENNIDNIFGDTGYFKPSGNEESVRLMNPISRGYFIKDGSTKLMCNPCYGFIKESTEKTGTFPILDHKDTLSSTATLLNNNQEIKDRASEIVEGMMDIVRKNLSGVDCENKTNVNKSNENMSEYDEEFGEMKDFIEKLSTANIKAKEALRYASKFVGLLNDSGLPFEENMGLTFYDKPFDEDWGLSEETGEYHIIISKKGLSYGVSKNITTQLDLERVIFPITVCEAIIEFADGITERFMDEYS